MIATGLLELVLLPSSFPFCGLDSRVMGLRRCVAWWSWRWAEGLLFENLCTQYGVTDDDRRDENGWRGAARRIPPSRRPGSPFLGYHSAHYQKSKWFQGGSVRSETFFRSRSMNFQRPWFFWPSPQKNPHRHEY